MRKLHHHRQKIAFTLIAILLMQIGLSPVAMASGVSASTAGPTSPESTSFEPFDASDMVNLITGDLAYTIPLLEIPGPAGSYPMALSYHSGIKVKQEPSWVGLGWSLGPGAINRQVNGVADDYDSEEDVHERYWVGGKTVVSSVGITLGYAVGTASVGITAGLQIANDTYQGRGVGGYIGYSARAGINSSNADIGVSYRVGVSPYGESYASAGVSVGAGSKFGDTGLTRSAKLGLKASSNNGVSAGLSGGVSASSVSIIGADLSTDGGGVQISAGGGNINSTSAKVNKLSSSTDGGSFSLPVYPGISLTFGMTTRRYWINNKEQVEVYGSLNQRTKPNYILEEDDYQADVYDLFDYGITSDDSKGLYTVDDEAIKQLGGTFPDYDGYTVAVQGMGGAFQPAMIQHDLIRPMKHGETVLTHYASEDTQLPVSYRFIGDFSNRMKRKVEPDFGASTLKPYMDHPVLGNVQTHAWEWNAPNGPDQTTYDYESDGYRATDNHLAGSRHIEYYRNADLVNNANVVSADCIDRSSSDDFPSDQIGGFEITNSNGVTYHFMLPAYSKNEYIESENLEMEGKNYYKMKKPKYAYTWLLTAVTGPDYVERGNDGLDEKDFGYWVSFDYNKWEDEDWRNPEKGWNEDIEPGTRFFTSGTTERYYLDRVKTASHTALFVKSSRMFDVKDKAQLDAIYLLDNSTINDIETTGIGGQTAELSSTMLKNLSNDVLELIEAHALNTFAFGFSAFDAGDQRLKLDRMYNKGLASADVLPPTIFRYRELNDGIGQQEHRIYDSEAFDLWDMYKVDHSGSTGRQNVDRLTTLTSAERVDMWSLNEIVTATGQIVNIDYESDSYSHVEFHQNNFHIGAIESHPEDNEAVNIMLAQSGKGEILEYMKNGAAAEFNILAKVELETNEGYDDGGTIYIEPIQFEEAHINLKFRGYEEGGKLKAEASGRVAGGVTLEVYSEDLIKLLSYEEKQVQGSEDENLEGVPEFITNSLSQYNDYVAVNEFSNHSIFSGDPNLSSIHSLKITFELGMFSLDISNSNEDNIAFEKPGGGIRVKEISNLNPVTQFRKATVYDYSHPKLGDVNDDPVSSGTLLYEPGALVPFATSDFVDIDDEVRVRFMNDITKNYAEVLKNSRLLPSPEVLYEYVTTKNYVQHPGEPAKYLPTYSRYNFEMYDRDMLQHDVGPVTEEEWFDNDTPVIGKKTTRHYTMKKNKVKVSKLIAQMGQLKSIARFTTADHAPVSKSIYNYLHDNVPDEQEGAAYLTEYLNLLDPYEDQGLINETFGSSRASEWGKDEDRSASGNIFQRGENYYKYTYLNNIALMDEYPVIKIGETHIDYRTGTTKTVTNLAFDFYSGDAIATRTTDSNGRTIIVESDPAYWHYDDMGVAINGGKNMLTQPAAQVTYLENGADDQVLSATITTWDDAFEVVSSDPEATTYTTGIWRKKAGYQYLGDLDQSTTEFGTKLSVFDNDLILPLGPPAYPGDQSVSWDNVVLTIDNQVDPWQKSGEITKYDVFTHALEAKNVVNAQYSSTKMTPDFFKVLHTAVNSQYEEMAFSGAEEMFRHGLTDVNSVTLPRLDRIVNNKLYSHSGECFVQTFANEEAFSYSFTTPAYRPGETTRKYKAMVWCYLPQAATYESDNVILWVDTGTNQWQGTINQDIKTYGSWQPIEVVFEATSGQTVEVVCKNNTQSDWAVRFDDFRVQPYQSNMQSFVYDLKSGRLNYTLDNNNFYTQYKYDEMGRLTDVVREINHTVPRYEQSYRYWNKFSENKN